MAYTEKYVSVAGAGAHDGTSEANAWTLVESVNVTTGYAAGDRVNVISGTTYTLAATLTLAVSATANAPVRYQGYTTTIGDGGRPTIDCTASSYQVLITGNTIQFVDFDITGSASIGLIRATTSKEAFIARCDVLHTNAGSGSIGIQIDDGTVVNCHVDIDADAGQRGIICLDGSVIGCLIRTIGTGIEGNNSNRRNIFIGNRIYNPSTNTGTGINFTNSGNFNGPLLVLDNSIAGFVDGVQIDSGEQTIGAAGSVLVGNNVIWDYSAYGIQHNGATPATAYWNMWNNAIGTASGTADYDMGAIVDLNAISLTADPFTDFANGDMSLNAAAGGGALCQALGLGNDFSLDGTPDDFKSVGAYQFAEGAGGGGGTTTWW